MCFCSSFFRNEIFLFLLFITTDKSGKISKGGISVIRDCIYVGDDGRIRNIYVRIVTCIYVGDDGRIRTEGKQK